MVARKCTRIKKRLKGHMSAHQVQARKAESVARSARGLRAFMYAKQRQRERQEIDTGHLKQRRALDGYILDGCV